MTKKYGRDFLKQVIVRVDFARPLEIPKKGPKQAFRKALADFPILSLQNQTHRTINIEDRAQDTVEQFDEWTMQNEKAKKKAVLFKSALYFDYSSYPGFDVLRSEFLGGMNALFKSDPDVVISRFGLRYINQIELDEDNPTDWSKWLTPELLSSFKLADDVNTVSRAFNVLEFSYPDDTKMRFQYGMPNADYPSPIKRKSFVLDYDAYIMSNLDRDQLEGLLDTFYLTRIKPAFEQVLTPALRTKMRSKKATKHEKR